MRRSIVSVFLVAAACSEGEAPPPVAECAVDLDCALGKICHADKCISPARLDCIDGSTDAPVFVASATRVDFGTVSGSTVTRTLTIDNTGTCTLSVVSAVIDSVGAVRFACADCARAPLTILPGRSTNLAIEFLPGAPGRFEDTLTLTTNDANQPRLVVQLIGDSAGDPVLNVSPTLLDFGYVPVNRQAERVVRVINAGVGTATLTITSVELVPPDSTAFSFDPTVSRPITVVPARIDGSAGVALTVRHHPRTVDAHRAKLIITAQDTTPIEVELRGSDIPPASMVQPRSIAFGDVNLGQVERRRITVQNTGQSPLVGEARLQSGANADLMLARSLPDEIGPGGVFELWVVYAPTIAGPLQDVLQMTTNDPSNTMVSIPLTGAGIATPDQLVTVEMRFDNGSSSLLDLDIRDVDLILENPNGQVCREANPSPLWGNAGTCAWAAQSPGENPERVVLSRVQEDGTYRVRVSYIEDCKTLPAALAASLLGIGTEALVDYLSEGEAAVDPTQVAEVIAELCIERASTNVTMTVRIDGVRQDPPVQVRLPGKGSLMDAFTLVRTASGFAVVR